jgi:molybdenum cofactor biosynthesis protein MoaC
MSAVDKLQTLKTIETSPFLQHQVQKLLGLSLEGVATTKTSETAVDPCLQDSFGRRHSYLRISLVESCNLACTYCMPEEGHLGGKVLNTEKAIELADWFIQRGVSKVRLTGGEPTLHPGLEQIVRNVRLAHPSVHLGLTTNGVLLGAMNSDIDMEETCHGLQQLQPHLADGQVESIQHAQDIIKSPIPNGLQKLLKLKFAGLNSINISCDTLDASTFAALTRRTPQTLLNVLRSIVWSTHLFNVKVNAVVEKSRLSDWMQMSELTRMWPIEVRAIEFMPFHGNKYSLASLVSKKELEQVLPGWRGVDTPASETAQVYKRPGYRGTLGIVSSMTNPFCGGCNRVRITSDGKLKVCLHGDAEVDLLDALNSGEMEKVVGTALKAKFSKHAGVELLSKKSWEKGRPMVSIGGFHTLLPGRQRTVFRKFGQLAGGLSFQRHYSNLTHVTKDGISMVDVGEKGDTKRTAVAKSIVWLSKEAVDAVHIGSNKGNVLVTAQVAATSAVKRTWDVIPLCHPIPITSIKVEFSDIDSQKLVEGRCALVATVCVSSVGRTGVEMEALHGATIAALTVYDMIKAVDRGAFMECFVVEKEGGKSGPWKRFGE